MQGILHLGPIGNCRRVCGGKPPTRAVTCTRMRACAPSKIAGAGSRAGRYPSFLRAPRTPTRQDAHTLPRAHTSAERASADRRKTGPPEGPPRARLGARRRGQDCASHAEQPPEALDRARAEFRTARARRDPHRARARLIGPHRARSSSTRARIASSWAFRGITSGCNANSNPRFSPRTSVNRVGTTTCTST